MRGIILTGICLLAALAHADTQSVLTIQRTNYHSFKRLYYDLTFDKTHCQIPTASPFDVYYRDIASGQRLPDFSSESASYFGARTSTRLNATSALLEFGAMDDVEKAMGMQAQILVSLNRSGGNCVATTEISYANKQYALQNIEIQLKETLGFPSGVDWVLMEGRTDSGSPMKDCVIGACN